MRTRLLIASTIIVLAGIAATTASALVRPRTSAGTPVTATDAGATVALFTPGRRGIDGQFCGGTAIAAAAVLTAAHCVEGLSADEVDVVAGRARLSDEGAGRRVQVTRIVRAPGWDAEATRNDAAVLLTAQPLGVTPVALAGAGDGVFEAAGRVVSVAGWGLTSTNGAPADRLRVASVPIRPNATCKDAFGPDFQARTMLCTAGKGTGTCSGDSGGPLVVSGTTGLRQVGIVSYSGERCGERGVPDVSTRVRSQVGWILPLIGGGPVPAAARPTTARARFGRISCGPVRCRVEIRVRSDRDVSRLVVRAARRGSRTRAAGARRAARGRWVVSLDLPRGRVTLGATPLRPDGSKAGKPARLLVDVD